jgi:hypothetical protein
MKSWIAIAALGGLLVGCAAPPPPMIWVRIDGQRGAGNPALEQQFELAKTVCIGEMQKAGLSGVTLVGGNIFDQVIAANQRNAAQGDVLKGCMAQQGYVLVPADQASIRSDEFARVNAQTKASSQKLRIGPAH